MRSLALSTLALSLVAGSAFAEIPEGDVYLEVSGNQLLTGRISEDGSGITPGVRVHFAHFGADVPNVTDEPGIQSIVGGLGSAATFRLDYHAALRRWNGSDFTTIAAETLTADLGPLSATSPAMDMTAPGITIPVDPMGSHEHPDWTLGVPASSGVYLQQVRFITDTGFTSQPVWMLFGQNVDETTSLAAYEYALATVPTPSAAALGMIAANGLLRRKRR